MYCEVTYLTWLSSNRPAILALCIDPPEGFTSPPEGFDILTRTVQLVRHATLGFRLHCPALSGSGAYNL